MLSAFLKKIRRTRLYTMEGLDVSACYGQLAVSPPPVIFFWTIIYRLARTYKRAAGAACDANCDERSQHFSKIGPMYMMNVVAPSYGVFFSGCTAILHSLSPSQMFLGHGCILSPDVKSFCGFQCMMVHAGTSQRIIYLPLEQRSVFSDPICAKHTR